MATPISEVEEFLRELLIGGNVSKNILNIDLEIASNREIAHSLGEYLKQRCRDVKIPRVYQFLNLTLKESIDEVEDDLNLLLDVITVRKRDIIENIIDSEQYRAELFSTVGLTRLQNQDYLAHMEFPEGVLLIVADGVGGGDSGEIASKLVVESILESFNKHFNPMMSRDEIERFLVESILEANERLVNFSKKSNKYKMATTLTLTLTLHGSELYIAHVGDSRVYELNGDGEVIQRTLDHSVREVLFRSIGFRRRRGEEGIPEEFFWAMLVRKEATFKGENIFIEVLQSNIGVNFLLL